jgi:hypothetical protein
MSANFVVINVLQTALKIAQEKHEAACAEYKKVKAEVNDTGEECAALYKAIAELQVVELSTPQVVELSTPQVVELSMAQTVSRSMAVSQSTPQVVSRSMAVSQSTQAVSRSTQAVSRSMAVSQSTPQAVSRSTPQASRSTALVPRSPEVVDLSTLQVVDQDTSWHTVKKTAQQSRTMCTVITNSMFDALTAEDAEEVLYEKMGDVEVKPIQVLKTHRGDWKIKFVMSTSSLVDVKPRSDHDGRKVWTFKGLDIRTFDPNHTPSHGRTDGSDNGSNGSGPRLVTMRDFFLGGN